MPCSAHRMFRAVFMFEIIPFSPDFCTGGFGTSSGAQVRVVDTLILSEIIVARQLEKGGLEYMLA